MVSIKIRCMMKFPWDFVAFPVTQMHLESSWKFQKSEKSGQGWIKKDKCLYCVFIVAQVQG